MSTQNIEPNSGRLKAEELAALVGGLSDDQRELLELLLKEQGVDLSDSIILAQKRCWNKDGSGYQMPLSYAQERLFFLDQLEPNSTLYNLPTAVRLDGNLDIPVLIQAIHEIIQRHEILRTIFSSEDGQPFQLIKPNLEIDIPLIDLGRQLGFTSPISTRDQVEAEIQRLAVEDARKPFNLTTGPLLRVSILRVSDSEHIVLLNVHHIIADGWSVDVLLFELAILYQAFLAGNGGNVLPALPIQFADYAVWQRKWLQGKMMEKQLAFWMEKFSDKPGVLELPNDKQRILSRNQSSQSEENRNPAGCSFRFKLETGLARRLHEFSHANGVTIFMTLLAGFQTLLYRYSGQEDICVGVPVTNRTRAEIESLIGFIVNTVVVRSDLSGEPPFDQFLSQSRNTILDAFANQELPFEVLVEKLNLERDMSRSPLFQVMFSMQNVPIQSSQLPGITMTSIPVNSETAKFDLSLIMVDDAGQLSGVFEYNTAIFEMVTIERLAVHYMTLLAGILANPQQLITCLPILPTTEQRQVLVEWNDTDRPVVVNFVHELFEYYAEHTPDQTALTYRGELTESGKIETLTYAQLNKRAEILASYLQRFAGEEIDGMPVFGAEVPVGIIIPRSLDMVVAILAVLKAGGAYLPIDPTYPTDRIGFMVNDARVKVLLTQSTIPPQLTYWPSIAHVFCIDKDWKEIENAHTGSVSAQLLSREAGYGISDTGSENLAYIIYTSGSTGMPKGAMLRHHGLCNLVSWQKEAFGIDHHSRVLQFSSLSFDASVWEIFMALANGATLCLTSQDVLSDGLAMIELIKEQAITIVTLPPSVLSALPAELVTHTALPNLRTVVSAGEACSREIVARWSKGRRFFNAYGPTETTVCATTTLCSDDDPENPAIGRPIANTHLYIFDRHKELTPIGVPGELWIGGAGVARGYLNRPEITREKFVINPHANDLEKMGLDQRAGEILYRTGDLVRYRPDGKIDFLGRIDQQVKLRGYRIELGEIESALRQFTLPEPDSVAKIIQDAAVVLQEDRHDHRRLVAFIVLEQERSNGEIVKNAAGSGSVVPITVQVLREHLKNFLPEFMIPATFVILPALPLTPSGKIDRTALLKYDTQSVQEVKQNILPRTPTEQLIAGLFRQLLLQTGEHPPRSTQVSIEDSFFELGGHSLLAMQLISRLRDILQVEVPLRVLFDAPTVAGLAERVDLLLRVGGEKPRPAITPYKRDMNTGLPIALLDADQAALPLSFAQQRLWFLEQFDPGTPTYNIPGVFWFNGDFDIKALEAGINEIVRRHEVLRTSIITRDGRPAQVILPVIKLEVPLEDLGRLPDDRREFAARQLAEAEVRRPFILAEPPLFRMRVFRIDDQKHLVVLTMHHIISDGWSVGVIIREMAALYGSYVNRSATNVQLLPELPIQYVDFAAWQRSWLQGHVLAEQLDYWTRQLDNLPSILHLPTDRPRTAVQAHTSAQMTFTLDAGLAGALSALSLLAGCTLFMTMLSAFKVLLLKYAGQTDIVVGTPVANRMWREIEGLIGFFVNTLVLRTDLSGNPSFHDVMKRVRVVTLDAYSHQDIPFEMMVSELQPERDTSHSPLFQVMFVMQNIPLEGLGLPGIEIQSIDVSTGMAKFDLTLTMAGDEQGINGAIEYNLDLFEESTILRLADEYREILEAVVKDPDRSISQFAVINASIPGMVPRESLTVTLDERQPIKARSVQAPRTSQEKTLAEIWSRVLGVEQISVTDNFFELGGDSILSIQVTSQASLAGLHISPRQIFETPTIADLALMAGTGPVFQSDQNMVIGAVPLTPIEHWFLNLNLPQPEHFNQSLLLEIKTALDSVLLEQALATLIEHHDALRLRLRMIRDDNNGIADVAPGIRWEQFNDSWDGVVPFEVVKVEDYPPEADISSDGHCKQLIERKADQVQASLDIAHGPLIRMVYFDLGSGRSHRLLIVIHHLAVDGISWRILIEDLQNIYGYLATGAVEYDRMNTRPALPLPPKTASFQAWAQRLQDYAGSPELLDELDFWLQSLATPTVQRHSDALVEESSMIHVDHPGGKNIVAFTRIVHRVLESDETHWLVQDIPAVFKTEIQDILLAALIQAYAHWTSVSHSSGPSAAGEIAARNTLALKIDLEGHGREQIFTDIDLSRTVGWFTTIYPVSLTIPILDDLTPTMVLKLVKEQLRKIPRHGFNYGLLRYQRADTRPLFSDQDSPQISFNYLGQLDTIGYSQFGTGNAQFALAPESSGSPHGLSGERAHLIEINSAIVGGRFGIDWSFSSQLFDSETIERFADLYMAELRRLIQDCLSVNGDEFTPADFPLADIDQARLDKLLSSVYQRQESKARKNVNG